MDKEIGKNKAVVKISFGEGGGFGLGNFGAIIVVCLVVTFLTVRERYSAGQSTQYRGKEIARLLFANKPFIQLTAAALCIFIAFTLMGAKINYLFKYNLQNEGLMLFYPDTGRVINGNYRYNIFIIDRRR